MKKHKEKVIVYSTRTIQEGWGYRGFLTSEWWKEIRKKKLAEQNTCEVCGTFDFLQVHHKTYDRKKKYNPKNGDLVVLCRNCHKKFHQQFRTKKCMRRQTRAFILRNKK